MKFKPGDIVRLKSGGPDMTIVKSEFNVEELHNGYFYTTWFAGKKQERSSFHEDTIVLVEDDKK